MSIHDTLAQKMAMIRGKKKVLNDIINSRRKSTEDKMKDGTKYHIGEFIGELGTYDVYCSVADVRVGYRVMRDYVESGVFSARTQMNLTIDITSSEGAVGEFILARQDIPLKILPATMEQRIVEHLRANAPKFDIKDLNTSASFRLRQNEYTRLDALNFLITYQYCMSYTYLNNDKIFNNREFDDDCRKMYYDMTAAHDDILLLQAMDGYDDWIFNHTLNGMSEEKIVNAVMCMNYQSSYDGLEILSPDVEKYFIRMGEKHV